MENAQIETCLQCNADDAGFLRSIVGEYDRQRVEEAVVERTTYLLASTGVGLRLTEANLANLDLSGLDLRGAKLNRAQLHGANLARADLTGATMICPSLERTNFQGAVLRNAYIHALAAQVCDFSDADLTSVIDGTGSLFHGCRLMGATFDRAQLAGATFYQCDLSRAKLGANLQGATINECILTSASFDSADLSQCTITKCNLTGTRFTNASGEALAILRPTSIEGLNLANARLPLLRLVGLRGNGLAAACLHAPDADFVDCDLPGADLVGSDLSHTRFRRCRFANASFDRARIVGSSFSNCSLDAASLQCVSAENLVAVESTFRSAVLRGFKGRCAVFRDCDLAEADLENSYLYRAMLTGDPPSAMVLRNVSARGAVLVQSYIAADLSGADLRGARLAYARLNQSTFVNARLDGAELFQSSLIKCDMTGARLESVAPPFFASRCTGLESALSTMAHGDESRIFQSRMDDLLSSVARGST